MADNLKITTPINTNDNISKLRPARETPIADTVIAERVSSRNESQAGENNASLQLNRNSIFNKYIELLSTTPAFSKTMEEVLFSAFLQQTMSSDLIKRKDKLLNQIADAMKMDKETIKENIKFQQSNNTKFSGPLFDFLRSLYAKNSGREFSQVLGRFLKAYDGFFSAEDSLKSIIKNLNDIINGIPKSYGDQLKNLAAQLETDVRDSNIDRTIESNLNILKSEIIPKLGEYVARTNDFSSVRDTITLLVHNISRLNTSSRAGLLEVFGELLGFCRYNTNISVENAAVLSNLFEKAMNQKEKPVNNFFDTMISFLKDAADTGRIGTDGTAYKDLATSLLLDNSVFNPFTHIFLPVNYEGNFLFSEIWIMKDAEGGKRSANSTENVFRMFITFDIKVLGRFEAAIMLSDKNIVTDIRVPATLGTDNDTISENIKGIITRAGLNVTGLSVSKSKAHRTVYDVFPNVSGRRDIDVTV